MKTLKELRERKYPDGTKIPDSLPPKYHLSVSDKNCSNCGYYVAATKHCKKWDAKVRPSYWCAKWEPKNHKHEENHK